MLSPLDVSLPELKLRVGPSLLPLAAALAVVWDMACHSHKADVCLNCQKETKTTLWEVEGWVKKKTVIFRLQENRLNDTKLCADMSNTSSVALLENILYIRHDGEQDVNCTMKLCTITMSQMIKVHKERQGRQADFFLS